MNYRSNQEKLSIFRKNGTVAYSFKQNRLVVGDPELGTAGNVIDFTTQTNDLLTIERFPTYTVDGATDGEKCGLTHFFFEAPYLDAEEDLVTTHKYIVLRGSVTTNGVVKHPNQWFLYTTGDVITIAEGTIFHLWDLDTKGCGYCPTAAFKETFLETGDETYDYWSYENPMTPMNSMDTSYDNWYGKTVK
jgi:hypothetical protein